MAGVDGCRGGWVVVTAGLAVTERVEVRVEPRFEAVVGDLRAGRVVAAAVDMPIGLPAIGPRRCDVEARALLGARGSTVFPAPLRAVVGCRDYAEACARSRAASGKALSRQAFALLPRIEELDRLVRGDLAEVVVESHPELAFLRMNGGEQLEPKRTAEGRRHRLELLTCVLPAGTDLAGAARAGGAPLVDAIDAAALVATARRLVRGEAQRLGGELDGSGRPMQVAW